MFVHEKERHKHTHTHIYIRTHTSVYSRALPGSLYSSGTEAESLTGAAPECIVAFSLRASENERTISVFSRSCSAITIITTTTTEYNGNYTLVSSDIGCYSVLHKLFLSAITNGKKRKEVKKKKLNRT